MANPLGQTTGGLPSVGRVDRVSDVSNGVGLAPIDAIVRELAVDVGLFLDLFRGFGLQYDLGDVFVDGRSENEHCHDAQLRRLIGSLLLTGRHLLFGLVIYTRRSRFNVPQVHRRHKPADGSRQCPPYGNGHWNERVPEREGWIVAFHWDLCRDYNDCIRDSTGDQRVVVPSSLAVNRARLTVC